MAAIEQVSKSNHYLEDQIQGLEKKMDELKIKLIPRKPVKKVIKKPCDHEQRILGCEVEVQSKEREFL